MATRSIALLAGPDATSPEWSRRQSPPRGRVAISSHPEDAGAPGTLVEIADQDRVGGSDPPARPSLVSARRAP